MEDGVNGDGQIGYGEKMERRNKVKKRHYINKNERQR